MNSDEVAGVINLHVKVVLENTVRFLPSMIARGSG